eukprot:380543-Rhodomonas_salina.1
MFGFGGRCRVLGTLCAPDGRHRAPRLCPQVSRASWKPNAPNPGCVSRCCVVLSDVSVDRRLSGVSVDEGAACVVLGIGVLVGASGGFVGDDPEEDAEQI